MISDLSTGDHLLRNVRSNIVQSIRAFTVHELQAAATRLGQRFLYANLAGAYTREDVVEMIGEQFTLPVHFGQNFDALYDCLTAPLHKSGQQPGFIVVLEQIPTNEHFAQDAREKLLDTFRDAADYWNNKKVPFRCFYSFSVARAVQAGYKERPKPPKPEPEEGAEIEIEEKMPTDKLVDVTPLALRMSSPFNAQYWLNAVSEGDNVAAAS